MGNNGCFNVGDSVSYATANKDAPGQAPGGSWCLIKYADSVCNCIKDYEVIKLESGVDDQCHTLASTYESYSWHKIDVSSLAVSSPGSCELMTRRMG